MPRAGSSPTIMPYGADQTVYLVVDSFGANGTVYRETEVERTDLETIIGDLMSGQFNDPVRVVAFNTLEHWSKDVSADIAAEIRTRCDIDGEPVPACEGFCGAACSLNPAACPSIGLMPRSRKPRSTVGHQKPRFRRTGACHLNRERSELGAVAQVYLCCGRDNLPRV
jgi:hypothetical protein